MVNWKTRLGDNEEDLEMEPVIFRFLNVDMPSRKEILEDDVTTAEQNIT